MHGIAQHEERIALADMDGTYKTLLEFVLLPKANIGSAVEIAEKCRSLVQELAIPHERSGTGNVLTISIGVASLAPVPDSEPDSLFAVADRRLYQAKECGRNRVVSE